MDDYIKRDSFVADKRKKYCENCERRKGKKNGKMVFLYDIGDAPCRACEVDDMLCEVEDYPAADVREIVRGEWIERKDIYPHKPDGEITSWSYKCSRCNQLSQLKYNFCSNCGADMRGEKYV